MSRNWLSQSLILDVVDSSAQFPVAVIGQFPLVARTRNRPKVEFQRPTFSGTKRTFASARLKYFRMSQLQLSS